MLCGSAFFVAKWRLCSTAVCAIIILKKMKRKRKDIRIVLRKFKKREVLCMKKRSLNKIKQMVSIGMSCIMAGSTCNLPMMLHAEEVQTENMHPTYMVTSFDELNELRPVLRRQFAQNAE